MNEATISMFGPAGVGKTSLLTTMYEQFENDISDAKLQITPDIESSSILQDCLADLKSLFYQEETFFTGGGLQGTEECAEFIFELGKLGAKPSLRIRFIDFPGFWISGSANNGDREKLNEIVAKSQAILIAIHAPALMEKNGRYNEQINRPQEVTEYFKRNFHSLKEPRLVIFAPIKCEKYMQQKSRELVNNIKKEYARLLEVFKSEELEDKVSVVITPVQTAGNIILGKLNYDDENKVPFFYFTKNSPNALYNPKDSEQPLRYLLKFFLKLHLQGKENSWGIFSFLRNWLGLDEHLKYSITKFASACKRDEFFTVLQGERNL